MCENMLLSEISHAVLSGGRPVIAAGQAEIAQGGGQFFGIEITPHSGHFVDLARPDVFSSQSLQVGREAYRNIGIDFPE
jgi:hypothetical protein